MLQPVFANFTYLDLDTCLWGSLILVLFFSFSSGLLCIPILYDSYAYDYV